MKKILRVFIFSSFLLSSFVQAQEMDVEKKTLCNQTMLNIYNDISSIQNRYPELQNFGKQSLKQNSNGVYLINYQDPKAPAKSPYEFGLTLVAMDAPNSLGVKAKAFSYGFPLLGVKFIGYQMQNPKGKEFDIQLPIQKYGQLLWDEQQKYMPLQLSLQAVKSFFKRDEPIEFTVTLKNVTKRNLQVKSLSDQTLFFVYNGRTWGATEINSQATAGVEIFILKPSEAISKNFRGEGFSNPTQFEIYCSYALTFQGVKPASSLKIAVVK